MKKHGLIIADNGSNWYLSGAPDNRWNDDTLGELKTIPGSAFEAVLTVDGQGNPIRPTAIAPKAPWPRARSGHAPAARFVNYKWVYKRSDKGKDVRLNLQGSRM
jgi:hypothetical protein